MPDYDQKTPQEPKSLNPSNVSAAIRLDDETYGNSLTGAAHREWHAARNAKQDMRWVIEQELRNELGVPAKWEPPEFKIEFHRRQLALLLDKANEAPRCAHIFTDGRCCAAPRVKKGTLCYAHAQMEARKPQNMNLPPLEDANAVMIWIMEVSRGLLDERISERTAGLMFYGLQLAMVNARHTTFKETDPREMVRTAPKDRRNRRDRRSSPTAELQVKQKKTAEDAENRRDHRDCAPSATAGFTDEEGSAREARKSGRNEAELEGNPGVESAKSIFFGVEGSEGVGPSTFPRQASEPLRISPADSRVSTQKSCVPDAHACIPAQVESAKSIFSGVEEVEGVADGQALLPPAKPALGVGNRRCR